MRLIEDPVTKVRFFSKATYRHIHGLGSYPSWLRRFTVNKLAIATACSTHAYPRFQLIIGYSRIGEMVIIIGSCLVVLGSIPGFAYYILH